MGLYPELGFVNGYGVIYWGVGKIFTIGYAGIAFPRFVEVLRENEVLFLVDVRSVPRSKYFVGFNDANLGRELPKVGVKYVNLGREFGARQTDPKFFTDGVVDFEKYAQSEQFQNGMERVGEMLERGNVCLMCAEIDPLDCHRAHLCGRAFHDAGVDVVHIIARRNGEVKYEGYSDFEKRLLELYKKRTDDLQVAYREHNKKIGFKMAVI